jgi:hypothetical protein
MNRRPVAISAAREESGDTLYVACNDGSVFYYIGSMGWTPLPEIPRTAAAGAEQEPEPAEAGLALIRDAFSSLANGRNPVIIDKRPGVES